MEKYLEKLKNLSTLSPEKMQQIKAGASQAEMERRARILEIGLQTKIVETQIVTF